MQLIHRKLLHLEREAEQIKMLFPHATDINNQQKAAANAKLKTSKILGISGLLTLPLLPLSIPLLISSIVIAVKTNKQLNKIKHDEETVTAVEQTAINLDNLNRHTVNQQYPVNKEEGFAFSRQVYQGNQAELIQQLNSTFTSKKKAENSGEATLLLTQSDIRTYSKN